MSILQQKMVIISLLCSALVLLLISSKIISLSFLNLLYKIALLKKKLLMCVLRKNY